MKIERKEVYFSNAEERIKRAKEFLNDANWWAIDEKREWRILSKI